MIVITIKKKTSIDIFIVITVDLLKNICYNDIKGYCFARKPYKNLGESKKWESQTNLIFKAIWEPKEASSIGAFPKRQLINGAEEIKSPVLNRTEKEVLGVYLIMQSSLKMFLTKLERR